jgi:hypothetical protein
MITARFLLHLRWEAKNSMIASINASKPAASPLEFAASSNGRGTRTLVDEFGEDPVQCAQMHRRDLSERGNADDFGEGSVQRGQQNSNMHDSSVDNFRELYVDVGSKDDQHLEIGRGTGSTIT